MGVLKWGWVILLAACFSPALDGRFVCGSDGSCPPELVCVQRVCVAHGELGTTAIDAAMPADAAMPMGCVPRACDAAACGQVLDGCGGKIMCAACGGSDICGGGGPNLCGKPKCTPQTCKLLNAECGLISDGCATVLNCGGCQAGEVCGGQDPYRCN